MRSRWAMALLLTVLSLAAEAKPKLAFLGFHAGAGVAPAVVDGVSEDTQTELAGLGAYDVIGLHDLESLIGLEQKKQLLGCNDDGACVAELSGALGVDRALTGSLARVGDSVLVNLTLLDVPKAKVVARVGRRVSVVRGLDPLLDAVRPLLEQLVDADLGTTKVDAPSHGELAAVVRGELDVHLGGAAAAAGLEAQGELLGFDAMVVGPVKAAIPAGLRLEARLSPLAGSLARPYVTGGVTLFSDAPALRGSAGVEVALGPWRLFADLAYEHVLAAESADPVILALGAGSTF